jgi:hypothetical protein
MQKWSLAYSNANARKKLREKLKDLDNFVGKPGKGNDRHLGASYDEFWGIGTPKWDT